jgi:hypothetical protein
VTEAELRAVVVPLAHKHGWRVFSMPAARLRRPVKDASGYPDLTLARQGRVIWFELKTDTGALSEEQMAWLMALPSMHVIRPADLASGVVDAMLR